MGRGGSGGVDGVCLPYVDGNSGFLCPSWHVGEEAMVCLQ